MLNYVGCGLLWFHIAVAWLGFHGGSLREAWTHVAERTEQATGWYNGVGLYGNFAAAMLWAIACVLQNRAGTRGVAAKALVGIDTVLWFFFVNAAIVFARPISGTLFALLIAIVLVLRFRDHQKMVRGAPSDSES